MAEQKVKKSVSVRLDHDVLTTYQALIEGAELSVSDDMRLLVRRTIDDAESLDLKTDDVVTCNFVWKEPTAAFPELVGHLLVEVKPPKGLPAQILQRLIFVIPEFWTDEKVRPNHSVPKEHFRIDSAYFQRVTSEGHAIVSPKVARNVMSFHLYENKWFVTIFNYGTEYSKEKMQTQIENKVIQHIVSTIKCYLIGHLPESRILSQELHEQMVGAHDKNAIDRMTSALLNKNY